MAGESGREDPNYYVDMSRHDLQSVGTERKIRLKGFEATHLGRIRMLVEQAEGKLGAVQWLALAALAEWNARRAYAPPLERDAYGNDSRPKGLGHQVCMSLADEYKRRAKSATDARALPMTPNELATRFLDRIDAFTREIEGSLNDVEGSEANRNPDDAPERRATDKRMIDPAGFTPEALLDLVRPRSAAAPNGGGPLAPPPPPPQQPVSFYVAVNGQTQGPFDLPQLGELRRGGQLEPATLVYNAQGGTAWQPASAEPVLAVLFAPQPPPPPVAGFPPPPPTGALQ
jgi:hypothetical protein